MKKSVSLLLVVALIGALAFPLDNVFAKEHVTERSVNGSLYYYGMDLGITGSGSFSWAYNYSKTWSSEDVINALSTAYQDKYGQDSSFIEDIEKADSVSISFVWSSILTARLNTGTLLSSMSGSINNFSRGYCDESHSFSGSVSGGGALVNSFSLDSVPEEWPSLSVSANPYWNLRAVSGEYGGINSDFQSRVTIVVNFSSSVPYSTNEAVNDILDNQEAYHQEELDKGEQTGSDIQSSSSELEGLGGEEGKWKILWFPLTFTKQVIGVFTGANAVNIANEQVVGFRYDEETGMLIKVHSYDPVPIDDSGGSATIPLPNVGTKITFPSVDLPMIGTVWEPYTFDLAEVKEQFPLVFNAIYLVISVLEAYWFIGFLHDKFEEVFG